jgi:acyl-CoA thioesterase
MITLDAHTRYGRDQACRSLDIVLEEAVDGRARMRMVVTEAMANLHGIAHGGYVFLLADAAFAYASNATDRTNVAHAAQVTFLRPVEVGEELVAEAVARVHYGPNGVYDVTVRRADGEVVAEFRGHSVQSARRMPARTVGTPSGK